jgi:hypothetical protein
MNALNNLPDDVAIIIWKIVYDECVKSIAPYDLYYEFNKKIMKNIKKGKLSEWLLYTKEVWLKEKVKDFLESNTEELISYEYDDIAIYVLQDEQWQIIDDMKFSLDEMKDMINEIGIDNICSITKYMENTYDFEPQYVIDKNKENYGLDEMDHKGVLETIFLSYHHGSYPYRRYPHG